MATAALDEEMVGYATRIADRLDGSTIDKARRAHLLDELMTAFSGGQDAATECLATRFKTLETHFTEQLDQLKKKL